MSWLMSRHCCNDVATLELWCCSLELCCSLCHGDVATLENSNLSISINVIEMSRHCSNWHDTLHMMSRHCSSSVATLLPLLPFFFYVFAYFLQISTKQ